MDTIHHLRQLFVYDEWANRRIINSLKENHSEKCRHILAHLLITKQEYLERLTDKDSTGFDFWPHLSIAECSLLNQRLADTYNELLNDTDDSSLDAIARYNTSEGIRYENTIRDMLAHVLLHSSIHRGNIILKLREQGVEPPKIDYIIHLREIG